MLYLICRKEGEVNKMANVEHGTITWLDGKGFAKVQDENGEIRMLKVGTELPLEVGTQIEFESHGVKEKGLTLRVSGYAVDTDKLPIDTRVEISQRMFHEQISSKD
jgi:hypothetical protein